MHQWNYPNEAHSQSLMQNERVNNTWHNRAQFCQGKNQGGIKTKKNLSMKNSILKKNDEHFKEK